MKVTKGDTVIVIAGRDTGRGKGGHQVEAAACPGRGCQPNQKHTAVSAGRRCSTGGIVSEAPSTCQRDGRRRPRTATPPASGPHR